MQGNGHVMRREPIAARTVACVAIGTIEPSTGFLRCRTCHFAAHAFCVGTVVHSEGTETAQVRAYLIGFSVAAGHDQGAKRARRNSPLMSITRVSARPRNERGPDFLRQCYWVTIRTDSHGAIFSKLGNGGKVTRMVRISSAMKRAPDAERSLVGADVAAVSAGIYAIATNASVATRTNGFVRCNVDEQDPCLHHVSRLFVARASGRDGHDFLAVEEGRTAIQNDALCFAHDDTSAPDGRMNGVTIHAST